MTNFTCIQTGVLGVNTYIVPCDESIESEKKFFVVDPGGDAILISDKIKERNGVLDAIILTHGHFDHVGAVARLKDLYPDAKVCIHKSDSNCIGKMGYDTHRALFAKIGFNADDFFSHSSMPEADILLEDGATLPFSPQWKVIHTPGHTEGSVCLYNESQSVLLSGDTLFRMGYGRTDLPGGSFSTLKKSLEKLFLLPKSVMVCPGHEGTTTIGQEKDLPL